MGGAFTGVADDATAIYWNPAGACQIGAREITLGHTDYVADIKLGNIAYVAPVGNYVVGVGVENLYVEDWRRDIDGNVLGTFVNNLTNVGLMLSYQATNEVAVGGVVKGIYEQLDTERSSGVGIDLGMMYDLGGINLGLVVQNLGSGISYGDVTGALPTNLKVGIGYGGIASGKGLVSSDIKIPVNGNRIISVGGEYNVWKTLYLRGGYSLMENNTLGPLYGLNTGMGFAVSGYRINYGFAPFGTFGSIHRVSFNKRF
jgi:long-subunit fatty acid transport protein